MVMAVRMVRMRMNSRPIWAEWSAGDGEVVCCTASGDQEESLEMITIQNFLHYKQDLNRQQCSMKMTESSGLVLLVRVWAGTWWRTDSSSVWGLWNRAVRFAWFLFTLFRMFRWSSCIPAGFFSVELMVTLMCSAVEDVMAHDIYLK